MSLRGGFFDRREKNPTKQSLVKATDCFVAFGSLRMSDHAGRRMFLAMTFLLTESEAPYLLILHFSFLIGWQRLIRIRRFYDGVYVLDEFIQMVPCRMQAIERAGPADSLVQRIRRNPYVLR